MKEVVVTEQLITSSEEQEQNRIRSLEVVIVNLLPEIPAFAITLRELFSRVRRTEFPYDRNLLVGALIDLSTGFEHKNGDTYRVGVTAEKNKWWFGYQARYYIIRTPRVPKG